MAKFIKDIKELTRFIVCIAHDVDFRQGYSLGSKGPGRGWWSPPKGTHVKSVSYRAFGSNKEAATYATKHLSGTVNAMRQEVLDEIAAGGSPSEYSPETNALWFYTGDGGELLNEGLRKSGAASSRRMRGSSIGELDHTMARSESVVPENILVRRSYSAKFFDDMPAGTIFRDYGYVSTTVNPEPSKRFGAHQAIVQVPKGTRGFYIAEYSVKYHERELLLDRGQRFKVVQNDKRGVIVEVIHGL